MCDERHRSMNSGPKDQFAVVVVGAGAAGLAACARLRAAGLSVRVVEARNRIGGRAHIFAKTRFPLDLGCGWLHSADRNPWTAIACDAGFTLDKTAPLWARQSVDLGFSAEEQDAFERASAEFQARLGALPPDAPDVAAATLLQPGGRWNALLDAVSTYVNGAELDRVSVHDGNRYADSGVNWRVVEGYGAVIARFGAAVPVVLDCAVHSIDHGGARIRVETSRGTLDADAVIVTVPTPILAKEILRFRPQLADKAHAAAGLPLGIADKLFMTLDAPELMPIDGHLFGSTTRVETGSYHLRPFGRPLVEGFFGGALARDLEKAGPDAFFDFAVSELVGLFGRGVAQHLRPLVATRWAQDPHAFGSYSYALPGHAGARAVLAAPIDERIFFAGEACSPQAFTTAHGAYESGLAAAEAIIAGLDAPRQQH